MFTKDKHGNLYLIRESYSKHDHEYETYFIIPMDSELSFLEIHLTVYPKFETLDDVLSIYEYTPHSKNIF